MSTFITILLWYLGISVGGLILFAGMIAYDYFKYGGFPIHNEEDL